MMLLPLGIWVPILDGDDAARTLFDRHYSRRHYKDGRKPSLFVGPGRKLVLSTPCRRALFIWRKFKSLDTQTGINCSVFRNEGAGLSSDLIREADRIADERWPGERHYTYVDARKTTKGRSRRSPPGACFIHAGWRPWIDPATGEPGVTRRSKLAILERAAP